MMGTKKEQTQRSALINMGRKRTRYNACAMRIFLYMFNIKLHQYSVYTVTNVLLKCISLKKGKHNWSKENARFISHVN